MDDLRLSYSHWGMHSCYTYPQLPEPYSDPEFVKTYAWPLTYFSESLAMSYDAKYLHG